jgi:hypothetical protein
MTRQELLLAVIQGEFLLVGELRGAMPDRRSSLDSNTGDELVSAQLTILTEAEVSGRTTSVTINAVLFDMDVARKMAEEFRKGQRYVFFLSSLKLQGGRLAGWLSNRSPELLEGPA